MTCISDFDVGQRLGQGAFAVVHQARVRATGRDVAIKMIDKQKAEANDSGGASRRTATERIVNEVELHWHLKHPAVVELLDFFEDADFVYMVLELCAGGDLFKRLKAIGPMPERTVASYMGQVLSGLAYLHSHGVVHRDLKLGNLMLSADGQRLKLGDFGLATALESAGAEADCELQTICGTPNYMAPEIASKMVANSPSAELGYGPRVDLWS
eukprot:2012-Heterococcus_DN1.PRE.1